MQNEIDNVTRLGLCRCMLGARAQASWPWRGRRRACGASRACRTPRSRPWSWWRRSPRTSNTTFGLLLIFLMSSLSFLCRGLLAFLLHLMPPTRSTLTLYQMYDGSDPPFTEQKQSSFKRKALHKQWKLANYFKEISSHICTRATVCTAWCWLLSSQFSTHILLNISGSGNWVACTSMKIYRYLCSLFWGEHKLRAQTVSAEGCRYVCRIHCLLWNKCLTLYVISIKFVC